MKPDVVFVLENASWPALLVDAATAILRANPAAIEAFGPPFKGASPLLSAIWAPENGNTPGQFFARWERAPSPAAPLKFRVKGGGTVTHLVSICSTTTDGQKLFLLQLLPDLPETGDPKTPAADAGAGHKQKLDRAMQLARSVALDFNNALTSVMGHTSLLLSKAEPNHPWRLSLMEVEKSAAKAAEIANDLAEFSRQEKEARPRADGNLNTAVHRCVELCQQSQPAGIDWKLRLERRLFAAQFDDSQIQQAVVKILENAIEALPGQGQITVQSRNVELAAPTQDRNVQLAAGTYVCVEISDTGKGIEPEELPRVFEPFFTTKRDGHRGLGLALVYGIITNHRGGVAVSSQPGTGTSVRVYLPALKKFVKDRVNPGEGLGGKETILIVDDEELLLTMGETILSDYGYRVLTANNGQKALDLLAKAAPPVDLVTTDLVMPAMSGRELLEHIHNFSPRTRTLCMSGYVWPGNNPDSTTYLQKPFTTQELLMKVKHVITGESEEGTAETPPPVAS